MTFSFFQFQRFLLDLFVQGVSVQWVYVWGVFVLGAICPGGKCPGGICPGGKCPGGKCPRGYMSRVKGSVGTCPGVWGGGGGVTPSHRTPDMWAGDLGMHPYWLTVLIEISCL